MNDLLVNLGLCAPKAASSWLNWPFVLPGQVMTLAMILAKAAFLFLILGVIALLLRWLFGPGGPWREPWMDETARQTTKDDETGHSASSKQTSRDDVEEHSGE